jgi:hypothetical protein
VQEGRSQICKWVVPMAFSRQEIVSSLRRAGLKDAAADAFATLPDQPDAKDLEPFCVAHGLSADFVMNLMGGSP